MGKTTELFRAIAFYLTDRRLYIANGSLQPYFSSNWNFVEHKLQLRASAMPLRLHCNGLEHLSAFGKDLEQIH